MRWALVLSVLLGAAGGYLLAPGGPSPGRAAARRDVAGEQRLEREIAALRARVEALRTPSPSPESEPPPEPAPAAAPVVPASEAARATYAALTRAWRTQPADPAELARYREDQAAAHKALDEFAVRGEEAFVAFADLLREGAAEFPIKLALDAAWRPGCETHLFAVADDPRVSAGSRGLALVALWQADTPEVRAALRRHALSTDSPRVFLAAVPTLDTFGEPVGGPWFVGDRLFRPGWDEAHGYMLALLGRWREKTPQQIEEARRIL
jgi:hypothetical protein